MKLEQDREIFKTRKPRSSNPRRIGFDKSNIIEPERDNSLEQKIRRLIEFGDTLGLTKAEMRPTLTGSKLSFNIKRNTFSKRNPSSKQSLSIKERTHKYLTLSMFKIKRRFSSKRLLTLLVSAIVLFSALYFGNGFSKLSSLLGEECLIEGGDVLEELVRSEFPCDVCRNITTVPQVKFISREEFVRHYGYSGIPLLVKGAASHWRASSTFSFEYFQTLYLGNADGLKTVEKDCQFFPYNTEFKSLSEALNMSPERATLQEGELPWYIGWSNCDYDIGTELRRQYNRPYFLAPDPASVNVEWIFMGGPGIGAGIHIDTVDLPSWQAQISGTKTWTLIPSPECDSICQQLQVTMHKGDILTVDTNAWYHSTYIHPGELSITIGSEYD